MVSLQFWSFGLLGFFNGISSFMGYLMPKPSLLNKSDAIQLIETGIREFIPFLRVLVQKWL